VSVSGNSISKTPHPKNKVFHCTALFFVLKQSKNFRRKNACLRALQFHCKAVEVILGSFLTHSIRMPLANPSDGLEFVEVLRTEEKGSDVNFAVHLLNDVWLDLYDCAVIVTNDSDISKSMNLVKRQTSKKLGLVTPGNRHPSQLIGEACRFSAPYSDRGAEEKPITRFDFGNKHFQAQSPVVSRQVCRECEFGAL